MNKIWIDVYEEMPNYNKIVWVRQESGNISLSAYMVGSNVSGWAVVSIVGNKVRIFATEFLMKVKAR